ncbi:MAG: M23 family metallopeptidase [Clostridia bacterium]|nr:M23 family metallopeptidase [Clostridia bacterium]
MEKKIHFSDKSVTSKIVYAVVIAILCITAIVVGIVGAASRDKNDGTPDNPPVSDGTTDNGNENVTPPEDTTPKPEPKLTFVAPTAGTVVKEHSLEIPVFSVTLGEWRVHTGIDISCEEGAGVYASEAGVVSGIYSDPMLGFTVEITHKGDIKTRYSNLSSDIGDLKVGDEVNLGDKIGVVGDTSLSELAEEPHLHFELLLKDVKVNPMDYITEESKKASLGIGE